jgi:hypothetical protein
MDRRNFLRTGVASAVGAGALATAGCSSLPIPNPLGGGSAYTNWLHAPDEVGDSEHYSMNVVKPQEIINNEDAFGDDRVSNLEDQYDSRLEQTGVDADQISMAVNTSVTSVYTGNYNADDVTDELDDNDFDDDDEVGGFTIYTAGGDSQAWAVGSGTLIRARAAAGDDASDIAELAIETNNGEADRYLDEVEAMGILTNNLANGFRIFSYTYEELDNDNPEGGQFENSTGLGVSGVRNGETVTVKYVVAYEDSDDVDQGDLEDFVDANEDSTFDDVENISYNTSGRAGIIKGKMPADETDL